MKIKITRKDGVMIEVEGTKEECLSAIPLEFTLQPPNTVPWTQPVEIPGVYPYQPEIIWTIPYITSSGITKTETPNIGYNAQK
jgi:hypothetical protein